ncbi:MAG: lipocalin, partial [Gammaproteobacteria bacterium]|nr:lipocalin [Gammaproteobacteria bacterium]
MNLKLIHKANGILLVTAAALLISCTGVPEGTEPVTGFEPERYLGKWYEIA